MSIGLGKEHVGVHFGDAAGTYEKSARHQRIIAARLAGLVPSDSSAKHVLEIGCGTGMFTKFVIDRFPKAALTALDLADGMVACCRRRWAGLDRLTVLEADGETFTPEAPCDWIVSSCALQWFSGRDLLGRRFGRVLTPGGHVAVAVPLAGTLGELAASVRHATGRAMPGLPLGGAESYLQAFSGPGWSRVVSQQFDVIEWYRDPRDVFRAVREIGARCVPQGTPSQLSPAEMRAAIKYYRETFSRSDGSVSSTYKVLTFLAGRR